MYMLNLIRLKNKNCFIFFTLLIMIFTSCSKGEKIPYSEIEIVDKFFENYDESIVKEKIGKLIKLNLVPSEYIVFGGFPWALKKYETKEKSYRVSFVNINKEREKGCLILFYRFIYNELHPKYWDAYLLDAKYIPSKEGYEVHEEYLGYNLHNDGTCEEDNTRYGITLIPVDGWYPSDTKVIPMYILSFTEEKMIFDVPTDDEYFLYFNSHYYDNWVEVE